MDFELANAAGGGVSATGNDFKISGDVTGGRGFDFAVVAEFSMWDRSLVWIND